MSDIIRVRGTILSASPIGENDKRLVIETCELGKISAFAHGCRRPASALQAVANPFVTGEFFLRANPASYNLTEACVIEYFRNLAVLNPEVYVGFYFMDLVNYYGREGIDGTDTLNLLYLALKALINPKIDTNLAKRIFELRLIYINGELDPSYSVSAKLAEVCGFITHTSIERLFSFRLSESLMKELDDYCERLLKKTLDRELKSKKILDGIK